jgi:hypothetical protein
MKVKKNMRALWYFGGYSKLDFNCSYMQMKAPIDRETLYEKYSKLAKRDVLFLDYTDDGTKCEIFYLNEGEGRTETLNTVIEPVKVLNPESPATQKPGPSPVTQKPGPSVPGPSVPGPSVPGPSVPTTPATQKLGPYVNSVPFRPGPSVPGSMPKIISTEPTVKPKIEEPDDNDRYFDFLQQIRRKGWWDFA